MDHRDLHSADPVLLVTGSEAITSEHDLWVSIQWFLCNSFEKVIHVPHIQFLRDRLRFLLERYLRDASRYEHVLVHHHADRIHGLYIILSSGTTLWFLRESDVHGLIDVVLLVVLESMVTPQ
jgi:hypothetical protein